MRIDNYLVVNSLHFKNYRNSINFLIMFGILAAMLGAAGLDYASKNPGTQIGSLINKQTGGHLTNAEREANAFTTSEREAAQQWSEDMYNKYQSPQAQITSQVAGMRENGINPALMYGGSVPSAGSLPSASAGSSVSPSSSNVLSSILDFLKIKNDYQIAKERNKIESRRVSALEELNPSRIESNLASSYRNLTSGNLNQIDAQTRSAINNGRLALMYSQAESSEAQAALSRSGIPVNEGRAGLLVLQAVNQEIANKYANEYWSAEIAYKEALMSESYDRAAYYQHEIDYITNEALNSAARNGVIKATLERANIDIDMARFNRDHQYSRYLFDLGTQAAGALSGAVSAGASLGRTINYGRSVTAGIGEAAGRNAASKVIPPVFNNAMDTWYGN